MAEFNLEPLPFHFLNRLKSQRQPKVTLNKTLPLWTTLFTVTWKRTLLRDFFPDHNLWIKRSRVQTSGLLDGSFQLELAREALQRGGMQRWSPQGPQAYPPMATQALQDEFGHVPRAWAAGTGWLQPSPPPSPRWPCPVPPSHPQGAPQSPW